MKRTPSDYKALAQKAEAKFLTTKEPHHLLAAADYLERAGDLRSRDSVLWRVADAYEAKGRALHAQVILQKLLANADDDESRTRIEKRLAHLQTMPAATASRITPAWEDVVGCAFCGTASEDVREKACLSCTQTAWSVVSAAPARAETLDSSAHGEVVCSRCHASSCARNRMAAGKQAILCDRCIRDIAAAWGVAVT